MLIVNSQGLAAVGGTRDFVEFTLWENERENIPVLFESQGLGG